MKLMESLFYLMKFFTGYDYSRDEADQKFFEIFDNSIGDKKFLVLKTTIF